jgi:hypothetical protein
MLYLTQTHDAREYTDTTEPADALLDAINRRACDVCSGPVSWASRTILVHGSTLDHQTMYLTVACPLCLPTAADRLSLR